MNKTFFNAVMYDILNWSLNFTFVAFLWSMSHVYAVALTGLFVLRFAADWLHRKSWMEEMAKEKQAFLDQMQSLTTTPEELKLEEQDFEQLEFTEINKTNDDKKVH